MKWSELDLDAGVWMLPSARTKTAATTAFHWPGKPSQFSIGAQSQRSKKGSATGIATWCSDNGDHVALRIFEGEARPRCEDAGNPWLEVQAVAGA